eukprot:INCI3246.2.p1 GENE.INCI3246.2~~INCI3246.2.p1  ORF type:complete len:309 (-),score=56.61 INCI3246.2:1215-2141(-)
MSEAESIAVRDGILQELEARTKIDDLRAYCEAAGINYKLADGVVRGLSAAEYTVIKDVSKVNFALTAEALGYLEHGSPEFRFLARVPAEGKLLTELQAECGDFARIGMAKCMMNRWIKQDKAAGTIHRAVEGDVEDKVVTLLRALHAAPADDNKNAIGAKDAKDLKKRKLLKDVKLTTIVVKKGSRFSTTFKKQVADLTKDMLDGDSWKDFDFRPANLKTFGADLNGGFLHPLMKVRAEFRKILLGMGYVAQQIDEYFEVIRANTHMPALAHPTRRLHSSDCMLQVPMRSCRLKSAHIHTLFRHRELN